MNREAYLEKFKANLDEWNAELNRLQAKANEADADMKIKYEEKISSLQDRMDEARKKAAEIQDANGNAWEDLKQGAEDAWNRLREAMEDARSDLK